MDCRDVWLIHNHGMPVMDSCLQRFLRKNIASVRNYFVPLHGEGIQRVLYGTPSVLPVFCIPSKVCLSYRLTSVTQRLLGFTKLPLVKRISHNILPNPRRSRGRAV